MLNDTTGSSNLVKAGDDKLVDLINSFDSPGENNLDDDTMKIIRIKRVAMSINAINFVPMSEAMSREKSFYGMDKTALANVLRVYYPDPILRITTMEEQHYIMPINNDYIEASNWVNQYGIEMSGEYEALIICEKEAVYKRQYVNYPEMADLLKRIDEYIKFKTGIDLYDGIRAIPIAVYKEIGRKEQK